MNSHPKKAIPIDNVEAARLIDEDTHLLIKPPQHLNVDELEDSPLAWPLWYKWTVVVLVKLMTMLEYVCLYSLVSRATNTITGYA